VCWWCDCRKYWFETEYRLFKSTLKILHAWTPCYTPVLEMGFYAGVPYRNFFLLLISYRNLTIYTIFFHFSEGIYPCLPVKKYTGTSKFLLQANYCNDSVYFITTVLSNTASYFYIYIMVNHSWFLAKATGMFMSVNQFLTCFARDNS
jgi:hypothetical protein